MNIPECQHYKDAYDTCYREKVSSQISKLIFTSTTASACDDPFQLYKDCVETAMKKRIEESKKPKTN